MPIGIIYSCFHLHMPTAFASFDKIHLTNTRNRF